MFDQRLTRSLLALLTLWWSGCAALDGAKSSKAQGKPQGDSTAAEPQRPESPAARKEAGEASEAAQVEAKSIAGATGAKSAQRPAADSQAMAEVIAELQLLGALDQAAQQRLMEDLQKTDPALWPQLVQYFRASLELRKKRDNSREDSIGDPERVAADTEPTPLEVRRPEQAESGLASPRRAESDSIKLDGERPSEDIKKLAIAKKNSLRERETPAKPATDSQVVAAAWQAAASTSGKAGEAETPSKAEIGSRSDAELKSTEAPLSPATDKKNWQSHLTTAIQSLESQTGESPANSDEVARHASLRMLYLINGRRSDAARPIPGIAATQQDFWSKQMFGLSTYLDADRNPDNSRRAAEAGIHLRDATAKLGEIATLRAKNLAFCTEVSSFGVYKRFEQNQFQAGQEVLLYAEVENFKSTPTDKGFHTTLKSSYQILDAQGARVADHEFPVTQDYCQNARHDFFIRYFLFVPKKIYGGTYTLQLTIEDSQSQKIGQSSIEFTVKEK